MIAKNINAEQFKDAIKKSFEDDKDIYALYNPNVKIDSVEDIVSDISSRIKSDITDASIKGVYDKNNLIGYYVYDLGRKTLVSFGLSVEYRRRKYLNEFFSMIRSDLKGMWQVFLWTRNIRGIKWLQKNGCKIVATDQLLTHLIY